MKRILITQLLLLGVLGCNSTIETAKNIRPISESEAELFETILRTCYDGYREEDGCTYYLTCTPPSEWEGGNVADFPDSFYERLSDLPVKFNKATEAQYAGSIFFKDPDTGKSAFLEWIVINKWISDVEVEVNHGSWYEPLWGNGSTAIYVRIDGKWQLKKRLEDWIS
jgi:hypothetical protein